MNQLPLLVELTSAAMEETVIKLWRLSFSGGIFTPASVSMKANNFRFSRESTMPSAKRSLERRIASVVTEEEGRAFLRKFAILFSISNPYFLRNVNPVDVFLFCIPSKQVGKLF